MNEFDYILVQITDMHLFSDPTDTLLGVNTEKSFLSVLEHIQQNLSKIDHIVLTGDLSQDGSTESYQRLFSQLRQFSASVSVLPGNHDHKFNLQNSLPVPDPTPYPKVFTLGPWRAILLDSVVVGHSYGQLDEHNLQRLQTLLQEAPRTPTMVFLHHHPLPMQTHWIDTVALKESDDFLTIIRNHPQVKVLCCGHVHQDNYQLLDYCNFYATPSTCVQFKPRTHFFTLDNLNPGYRVFYLKKNGTFATSVYRIPGEEFEPDTNATGYK